MKTLNTGITAMTYSAAKSSTITKQQKATSVSSLDLSGLSKNEIYKGSLWLVNVEAFKESGEFACIVDNFREEITLEGFSGGFITGRMIKRRGFTFICNISSIDLAEAIDCGLVVPV